MNQSIFRYQDHAQKSVQHLKGDNLDYLLENTRQLIKQGLATPSIRQINNKHVIEMPWIEGESTVNLLQSIFEDLQALYFSTHHPSILEKLIAVVVFLHQCNPSNLRVEDFDCWRRINPRLKSLTHKSSHAQYYKNVLGLVRLIQGIERDMPSLCAETVPVHGDLHIGQWIYQKHSDRVFLIDLEDIALGDRESDIANFAAHFATSCKIDRSNIFDQYVDLCRYAADIYHHKTSIQLDEKKLDFYGACALLRRALKLHEQDRQPHWLDVLDACQAVTRSLLSKAIQQ